MPVHVRYYTDPACSASWAAEPKLRSLMVEFGAGMSFTYVMGGLARSYEGDLTWLVDEWLDAADGSGMPVDPRLWREGPIASTYPACMAVKAAAEQGADAAGRYLRALREGLMCFRRKLDTTEALVEEARGAALEVERFRIDLGSHAIVEAFGADLEETRTPPEEARQRGGLREEDGRARVAFPSARFSGEEGADRWVFAGAPYGEYRDAALAVGARPEGARPDPLEALRRFGRMATVEVEAVCDLPGPRAAAELWRLATNWRVAPVRVLTGMLWEPA
jgi:putative protein-disulfide isomerase